MILFTLAEVDVDYEVHRLLAVFVDVIVFVIAETLRIVRLVGDVAISYIFVIMWFNC